MRRSKPIAAPGAIMFITCLIVCAASCSPTPSWRHPLEAEFQRHEIPSQDLPKYAGVIGPAERLLAGEGGVPDSALAASRKSVQFDSASGAATVMFRFDPGDDFDDAHWSIYIVEVLPDLACRFEGAVEFEAAR